MIRRLRTLVLSALVPAVVLGPGVAVAARADLTPTVSFGKVAGASGCTSTPDIASVTVPPGAAVTVVNRTGTAATVDTGAASPPALAAGAGTTVRLAAGVHQVRLVPQCTSLGPVRPVTVTVAAPTAPPTTTRPRPTSSRPVPPAPTPGGRTTGSTATSTGPTSHPPAPTSVTAPVAPVDPGSTGPTSPPALAGPPSLPPGGDSRGVHLLSVVALICIFGVTMGIIRAIRTERPEAHLRRAP